MTALSTLRPIRIVAIPLTRPILRNGNKALQRLTYYQFQLQLQEHKDPKTEQDGGGARKSRMSRLKKEWLPEGGVFNWGTQKVVNMWTGFGRAEGGWKSKVYRVGQNLLDKTEFEELALKSFDPSLAPSITSLKGGPGLDGKAQTTNQIPLFYPPSQLSPSTALSDLKAYTKFRIPRHRNGLYLWLFITPFTFPLKLIPIIPNLPFFFCAWRSWSHYRAYKSSQYLHSLLQNNLIVPEPSDALDQIYKNPRPQPQSPTSTSSTSPLPTGQPSSDPSDSQRQYNRDPRHSVIVNHGDIPRILSLLSLQSDSSTAADLHQAIEQAHKRASEGRF